MPLWRPAPPGRTPTVTLQRWRVIETERGERHFVGRDLADFSGRVSSAIQKYAASTHEGETLTGRKYRLDGPPGPDDDAEHVFQHWCRANQVTSVTDVTMEYWQPPREAHPG